MVYGIADLFKYLNHITNRQANHLGWDFPVRNTLNQFKFMVIS